MLKHTAHRWLIAGFLAASVMVVATAGASSITTPSPWPAKCKTVACVNTYLNAVHSSNVVRSTKIATLNDEMTTNNAQHAAYTEEMKGYDKTIADMKATLTDTKATLADMKATIATLKTNVATLQAWQAAMQANLSHVDVTVDTNGNITAVVKPTTPMIYMMLFEKAGSPPPPIFP